METLNQKIARYQQIIITYLHERSSIKTVNLPGCENMVIADTEHHHYQLLTLGWTPDRYVHSLTFHLDIADDGKIWLRANWTDTDIAQILVGRGVAKSDIVLDFYPAFLREESEYAVG
jgi:XisI protein